MRMWLLGLLSLLLLSACGDIASQRQPLLQSALAAPSNPTVTASINTVFFDLYRQSLLAYQLQVPSFTGVTLIANSGMEAGLDAASSTLW